MAGSKRLVLLLTLASDSRQGLHLSRLVGVYGATSGPEQEHAVSSALPERLRFALGQPISGNALGEADRGRSTR